MSSHRIVSITVLNTVSSICDFLGSNATSYWDGLQFKSKNELGTMLLQDISLILCEPFGRRHFDSRAVGDSSIFSFKKVCIKGCNIGRGGKERSKKNFFYLGD